MLRRLDVRARTRHELADALRGKEVPSDVAAAVLDRFEELGLVDDADFADQWVRSRQASRGLSRRALSMELRRKGVDEETIARSTAGVSEEDELEAATRLAVTRIRAGRGVESTRLTRRVLAALARKGYSSQICWQAIRAAQRELGEEETGQEGPEEI
nr:regulatory protein RecX [Acidipropionibacterium jensenii]